MIIISKFKDYYDGGATFGVNTSRRYIRETQEIKYSKFPFNFNVIGFCGKIYPFDNIVSVIYNNPKKYTNYDPELHFEEYKDRDRVVDLNTDYRLVKKERKNYFGYWWHVVYHGMNKPQLFEAARKHKDLLNLFIQYQVPVFHIRGDILTLNPCLKDYAFYKVMDTTQAFQEIEMFLGNVLVSDTKVIVPVGDDNVIRDSKGFDKWTFRKEPEK